MFIFLYSAVIGLIVLTGHFQHMFRTSSKDVIRSLINKTLFGLSVFSWFFVWSNGYLLRFGFKIDPFSVLLVYWILFISGVVHAFSLRHMSGDRCLESYFLKLTLLTGSVVVWTISDHICCITGFWILNQILLARLIVYKSEWRAAEESGRLYLRSSLFGSLCLVVGLGILVLATESFSLGMILMKVGNIPYGYKMAAFLLIVLAAIVQSGMWPFQRWLLSSLNAPTPVSAIMYAGFINGGVVLVIRFASLVLSELSFCKLLIGFGSFSFVIGMSWNWVQSNVKKMLSCLTISQTGLMFIECGLGFFPLAVAHMLQHALWQSFLFLNAGSAIENKVCSANLLEIRSYIYSILNSGAGVVVFLSISSLLPIFWDTRIVLILIVWITTFHFSLAVFRVFDRFGFMLAMILSLLYSCFYGLNVRFFRFLLEPMNFWSPRPLGMFHIVVTVLVFLILIVIRYGSVIWANTALCKRIYVKMLNASRSDPKTITAFRRKYRF